MTKSKSLVVGGAGFIGSHLVDRLLVEGHSVVVLDDLSSGVRRNISPHVETIFLDARQIDGCHPSLKHVDTVFNLAAVASVRKSSNEIGYSYSRTHLINLYLWQTFRSFEPLPIFVHASSAAVYGNPEYTPIDERHRTSPISLYGLAKLQSEEAINWIKLHHATESVNLRFFNVYGPRQDPSSDYSGVVSIFARNLAENMPSTIFSDGEQVRDFIYVGDVAEAMIRAAERCKHDPGSLPNAINICSGRATTMNELYNTMSRIAGRTLQPLYAPAREGDIRTSIGSPNLAQNTLGFRADTKLEDGIAAYFAHETLQGSALRC